MGMKITMGKAIYTEPYSIGSAELIPNLGTLYGREYYCVAVNGLNYYGDYNVWNEMIEWAIKTFGPTPKDGVWSPDARWYVHNAKFWFREGKDREWFILRWS
jgi:hypothetical protein